MIRRRLFQSRMRRERDLDEEIQSHLQLAMQDRIRQGETSEQAASAARREFGNTTLVKETAREVWGWTWLESLLQDVRYAIRTLCRTPAFTITAIAALALGIGANTAIFSLVDTVLLKPLRAPDPDRIVAFTNGSGEDLDVASPAKFNIWLQQTDLFQDVSAYRSGGAANLTGGTYPEQIHEMKASAGFFRLFGALIAQGRSFTCKEDSPGGGDVAILTDAFWKRRFAGDPRILGKNISLSGVSFQVIGILGAGFRTESGMPPDIYVPFQIDPNSLNHGNSLRVSARLKPGVTLAAARARVKVLGEAYRRKFPAGLDANEHFDLMPLKDDLVGDLKAGLWMLQGAVAFVLLIACANLANLLLIRATGRQREMGIRAAIGAGRGRIVRQLLTESIMLAGAGCVPGLLLGMAAIHILLATSPVDLARLGPQGSPVTADWRVVAFTVALSIATAVLFGFAPAFQASRADLNSALREGEERSGSSPRRNRTRALLAISEMALALVLLIGAGWQIRSFLALRSVKPGFESHNVFMMEMSLTGPRFRKTLATTELMRDGLQRARAIPGVDAAGATICTPFDCSLDLPFIIAGRPLNGPAHGESNWAPVSAGYFNVLRIPLQRGRDFTDRDDGAAAPVAIVNQAMARKFWPNGEPLGARLIVGKGMGPMYDERPRQIIGIVGDIHGDGLDEAPRPAMYIPIAQLSDVFHEGVAEVLPLTWIVRTRVEPHSVGIPMQSALRLASGGLPVANARSMEEVLAKSIAGENFAALLLAIFGGCALVLSALGIYGFMAYSVQRQTHEIGVRIALGAEPGRVRNRVVLRGMRLASIGAATGLAAALGLSPVLASQFYGFQPGDPVVLGVAPVLLLAVAVAAVWFPAQRVSRVNPVDAIRHE